MKSMEWSVPKLVIRRRVMNSIRICALILSACFGSMALGQQPISVSDWTEFHRNNMQRFNPYETLLNVNNVSSLQLKWSFPTGQSVFSSPAVANGVVYIGSYDRICMRWTLPPAQCCGVRTQAVGCIPPRQWRMEWFMWEERQVQRSR